jgi:fatty-acyl-CoA synthase
MPPVRQSFAVLLDRVLRAANAFREAGLAEDESVALLLPADPAGAPRAVGRAGAGRACPINTLLSVEHAAHLLREARATMLVALGPAPGHDTWSRALALRERVPGLKRAVPGRRARRGARRDRARRRRRDRLRRRARRPAGGRLAFDRAVGRDTIAATFPHRRHHRRAEARAPHARQPGARELGARRRCWRWGRDDVILNGFPVFHVPAASSTGCRRCWPARRWCCPTANRLRDAAFVRDWWRWVERERVTLLAGVPTVIATLLTLEPGDATRSRVRAMLTGGSPLPNELAQAFEARYRLPVRNILA